MKTGGAARQVGGRGGAGEKGADGAGEEDLSQHDGGSRGVSMSLTTGYDVAECCAIAEQQHPFSILIVGLNSLARNSRVYHPREHELVMFAGFS
jgi:hypothetical protein